MISLIRIRHIQRLVMMMVANLSVLGSFIMTVLIAVRVIGLFGVTKLGSVV